MINEMKLNDLVKALTNVVGRQNVLTSPRDLIAYSYDATGKSTLPDVVVFPARTNDVRAIMKIAYQHLVPVVARGAGTNLTGGTLPARGGIILELSRLNRIINIDVNRRRVVVEPGVVNLDLQNVLLPLGFMYAPDPASQKTCTLGGNMAEDAGGPRCLKYGVTSNHICSVELVLADGSMVQVGTSLDEAYGYDLLAPVVGSEGTLGIVTKLVLRIMRLPESLQTMLVAFESLDDAGQSVSNIIASGIVPGALELMDAPIVRAVEASVQAGYPIDAEAILIIEVDGLKEGLGREMQHVLDICRGNNAREIKIAHNTAERDRLWAGRRGAFGAVARVRPSYSCQDATVPRNSLVPMLRQIRKIAEKYQLLIGNVFHAGDGNFHPLIMFDSRDPEESNKVEKAGREILAACLPFEGTISGEHGIGLEKLDSMPLMFDHSELEVMRRIKNAFDPKEILNPGKVLPQQKPINAEVGFTKTISTSNPEMNGSLYHKLVELLGSDNVLAKRHELAAYEVDGQLPSLIVFPSNTDEICEIVKTANWEGIPIIPWGNGSKQTMGSSLAKMGIVLCMKRMDRLLEIDAPNLSAKVEAGMDHSKLNMELAKHGLCFPLEPVDIESSTVGGSLSTNSSSRKRLLYGVARDLVLGVTIVTPLGETIRVGGKTMKNVAGYDLRKLFLGSWGTLGVITEAILRLFYLPEDRKTLLMKFADIEDAFNLVRCVRNSFLSPESIELLYASINYMLEPDLGFELLADEYLLLLTVCGSREVVARHITEIRELAEQNNSHIFDVLSGDKQDLAWNSQRIIQLNLTHGAVRCKAVVPPHQIGEMFGEIRNAASRHKLQVCITGQLGNGILNPAFFPQESSAWNTEMLAVTAELANSTDKLEGIFLIESGPQEIRKAYDCVSQRSDYSLMREIKHTFDPKDIFNPGKVVVSR